MLNKVNGIKVLILLQTIIFIIVNIFYQKEVRLDQVSELNFNLIKKKKQVFYCCRTILDAINHLTALFYFYCFVNNYRISRLKFFINKPKMATSLMNVLRKTRVDVYNLNLRQSVFHTSYRLCSENLKYSRMERFYGT